MDGWRIDWRQIIFEYYQIQPICEGLQNYAWEIAQNDE